MKQKDIIKILQNNGYKITTSRKKITKTLTSMRKIFSIGQLAKKITDVNKASVYRTFEIFQKLNIIIPVIMIDGQQFFEKNNTENHHHHIICTKCKKTKCVRCKTNIPYITGFKNINHSLVLTGQCNKCI